MTTTITDDPLLRNLYRLPGPVLTAYLNAPSPTGPGLAHADRRLRKLLTQLHGCGAAPDALEALGSVLGTLRPGRHPVAAFVGADGQTRMFSLPDAEVADQVHCAAVPHVLPLLEWRQRHPAFATVMLRRDGAELTVTPAGAARPLRAEVGGRDDVDEVDVADALVAAEADLLIVGGDARAEQRLLDRLPARLQADVTIKAVADDREVEAAVQEYVDEESLRTLARVQDHSGIGVQGPAATLQALARAEVEVLVIAPCEAGTAWFGPRAGGLAPDERASQGPLDEVLARAAVLTDADIRILPQGLADVPAQGVGALRRCAED